MFNGNVRAGAVKQFATIRKTTTYTVANIRNTRRLTMSTALVSLFVSFYCLRAVHQRRVYSRRYYLNIITVENLVCLDVQWKSVLQSVSTVEYFFDLNDAIIDLSGCFFWRHILITLARHMVKCALSCDTMNRYGTASRYWYMCSSAKIDRRYTADTVYGHSYREV